MITRCNRRKPPNLHGFAEAHLIADEGAAAVAQRESDAVSLECHQTALQLGRDAPVTGALVGQGARGLRE